MTDRPIIFSSPMVRALLEGRKTQTRRLAWKRVMDRLAGDMIDAPSPWQHVQPGDRLYVRETWMPAIDASGPSVRYAADYDAAGYQTMRAFQEWRSPLHHARKDSRLTLVVAATRIERLHKILDADARAEGLDYDGDRTASENFSKLWRELHGVESWCSNPDVVVLTFRVVKANIDAIEPPGKA